ncbi:hypothetical protein HDV01_007730 [Terramyces sp. JEL0728]|nr:hypothetical protein HDV01_007730 [Terramyces sp. JEL0728]
MTTSLLTEGFLSMKPSIISSAEMICVFMLGGAFHLTYFALVENKLARTSKLRSHYLNFILGEWIDLVTHVVWMFIIADVNPEWIYVGFEVQHIILSIAQSGIRYITGLHRIQMTTFMCQTMEMPKYAFYVVMGIPYTLRVLWTAMMVLVTIYHPIPGFNLLFLLLCEAISFLHDLLIVKYAEMKLARGVDIHFIDLIIECIQPQTFSIIMVFSMGVVIAVIGEAFGFGYLSPTGTMIASAAYYTYRSVLVDLIDNYIMRFKSGGISGDNSNNKSFNRSQTGKSSGQAASVQKSAVAQGK